MLRLFKLVTGESVIAEVLGEVDGRVQIQNPLLMLPSKTGLDFVPWSAFTKDDKLELLSTGILGIGELSDELEDHMKRLNSTIITPPKKQSIIMP